jgi:hypothetical protein
VVLLLKKLEVNAVATAAPRGAAANLEARWKVAISDDVLKFYFDEFYDSEE